jgi:hypothetical protein
MRCWACLSYLFSSGVLAILVVYLFLLLLLLLLLYLWGPSAYAFRKHLSLMTYHTNPVLDFPTFSASSVLPRPLSRGSWSYKPVI